MDLGIRSSFISPSLFVFLPGLDHRTGLPKTGFTQRQESKRNALGARHAFASPQRHAAEAGEEDGNMPNEEFCIFVWLSWLKGSLTAGGLVTIPHMFDPLSSLRLTVRHCRFLRTRPSMPATLQATGFPRSARGRGVSNGSKGSGSFDVSYYDQSVGKESITQYHYFRGKACNPTIII